jgi:hypothetical protein
MGNDVADINNDGLADVVAVDMNPEDNYGRRKTWVATIIFFTRICNMKIWCCNMFEILCS